MANIDGGSRRDHGVVVKKIPGMTFLRAPVCSPGLFSPREHTGGLNPVKKTLATALEVTGRRMSFLMGDRAKRLHKSRVAGASAPGVFTGG